MSKERPILFSAPMVRALLDGSKTQTRRVCKPAEAAGLSHVVGIQDPRDFGQRPLEVRGSGWFGDEEGDVQFRCPYGKPGDRLWVRESFWGCDLPGYGDQPCIVYDDEWHGNEYQPAEARPWGRKFGRIPSIHMPRDASRILLEIVSVRVEQLQDISDEDALAEGVDRTNTSISGYAKERYRRLWESINGAGSWEANPWLWVVEFKRVPT